MTQTIEYVVKVSGAQLADANVSKVESAFLRTEAAAKRGSAAIDGASAKQATFQERVAKLPDMLGKQAAAISLVSSSLDGMGGSVGKVVAGAGQVAAAFGAGGPLAAALVAGMGGITLATKHFNDMREAADAAGAAGADRLHNIAEAARVSDVALRGAASSLSDALRIGEKEAVTFQRTLNEAKIAGEKRIDEAQQRLDKLKSTAIDLKRVAKEAEDIGITFQQARLNETKIRESGIKIAERALKKEETALLLSTSAIVVEDRRTKSIEATAKAQQNAAEWASKWAKAVVVGYSELEEIETVTDEVSRIMRGRRGVEGPGGIGSVGGVIRMGAADDSDILTVSDKQATMLDYERRFQQDLAAMRDEYREQELEKEKEATNARADMLSGAVIQTSQILAEGITAAAMGQEDAAAQVLSALSEQAGGFITLKGGEVLATGIAGMLTAPNPASAAQIAGGVGLIAAGQAVSVGGPAAISALMGAQSSSSPTASTRDPGASPRSSGGSTGSGGGLIVNVSYGAGGPLPEDVGREIYRATRSSDRRSGR
jgi:hypothetical protein